MTYTDSEMENQIEAAPDICCVQRCATPDNKVEKLYFHYEFDTSAYVTACLYHKPYFRENFPHRKAKTLDFFAPIQ